MSNPFYLDTDINGKVVFQEMTNAQVDYVVYSILKKFATTAGTIGSLTDVSSQTSIGVFNDTSRVDPIGTHPTAGSINQTNYTVYQNLTTPTITSNTPLDLSDSDGFSAMNETRIFNSIISRCINEITSGGVGSYKLQTSAPSGGTWVAEKTITDVSGSGNTTYYLWRKTDRALDPAASSDNKPLKFDGTDEISPMQQTDIDGLVDRLQKYITDTGIGTYNISQTAPTTGTWVSVGYFDDVIQNTGDVAYSGTVPYAGPASYQTTIPYAGTRSYSGTYTQDVAYTAYAVYYRFVQYTAFAIYRSRIGYVTNYGTFYQYADYVARLAYQSRLGYWARLAYVGTLSYTGSYTAAETFYQFATYSSYIDYYQYANYAGNTILPTTSYTRKTLWLRIS